MGQPDWSHDSCSHHAKRPYWNLKCRSVAELGVAYRPVRQTMLDHYESWRAQRGRSGLLSGVLRVKYGREVHPIFFGSGLCGAWGGWGFRVRGLGCRPGMIVGQNGKMTGMDGDLSCLAPFSEWLIPSFL